MTWALLQISLECRLAWLAMQLLEPVPKPELAIFTAAGAVYTAVSRLREAARKAHQ